MDREKVIKETEDGIVFAESRGFGGLANTMRDALALLKKQEAVVRCKDCKWWDKKPGSPYGYCHACKHGYSSPNWEIYIYRTYKGDWFCADGELRN